jgi:hypothetical protein
MKITEAIDRLQTLLEQRGDVELFAEGDAGYYEVASIEYDLAVKSVVIIEGSGGIMP